MTPTPKLETEEDLMEYMRQFLGGSRSAVDAALLAEPQYMIMGMSLEHIIGGSVEELNLPGVRYFLDTFAPSFRLTLDELD
jgi:maleate isomerase